MFLFLDMFGGHGEDLTSSTTACGTVIFSSRRTTSTCIRGRIFPTARPALLQRLKILYLPLLEQRPLGFLEEQMRIQILHHSAGEHRQPAAGIFVAGLFDEFL